MHGSCFCLSTWHKLEHLGKGTEKMPLSDWPTDKLVGCCCCYWWWWCVCVIMHVHVQYSGLSMQVCALTCGCVEARRYCVLPSIAFHGDPASVPFAEPEARLVATPSHWHFYFCSPQSLGYRHMWPIDLNSSQRVVMMYEPGLLGRESCL